MVRAARDVLRVLVLMLLSRREVLCRLPMLRPACQSCRTVRMLAMSGWQALHVRLRSREAFLGRSAELGHLRNVVGLKPQRSGAVPDCTRQSAPCFGKLGEEQMLGPACYEHCTYLKVSAVLQPDRSRLQDRVCTAYWAFSLDTES